MNTKKLRALRRGVAFGGGILLFLALLIYGHHMVFGTRELRLPPEAQSGSYGGEALGNLAEESAVLFGAAALALTLVTLLLAILTFIGWVEIRGIIEDRVEKEMDKYHRRERARILGQIGLMYGVLSPFYREGDSHIHKLPEGREKDLLTLAVQNLRKANAVLEFTEDDDVDKWRVMNNLSFYMARRGDDEDGQKSLELAQRIRRRYAVDPEPDFLTTYAMVIARYYYKVEHNPHKTLKEALELMEGLAERSTSTRHQKNAQEKAELLRSSLQTLIS